MARFIAADLARASLLTGCNHHSAGTGVITEMGDGYPEYSGQIPKRAAMFAEVLRQGGSTAFIGKNHNIADWETSISGPYDRWPSTVSLAERWTNGTNMRVRVLSRRRKNNPSQTGCWLAERREARGSRAEEEYDAEVKVRTPGGLT